MSKTVEWQGDPVYDWLLKWSIPGINIHIDTGTGIYPHKGQWKITTEYSVRLVRRGEETTIQEAKKASLQALIAWVKETTERNERENAKMDEFRLQARNTLALPEVITCPE